MNILAVDYDINALEALTSIIRKLENESNVSHFSSCKEAISYSENNLIDVAFLETDFSDYPGISLAEKLKTINGGMNIIFVTDKTDYMKEAFDLYASGYIVKPISKNNILSSLDNLRYKNIQTKYLKVKTFGCFEVYKNNKPIIFHRSKAKELFAYLVTKNGTTCTINELIVNLLSEDIYVKKNSAVYMRKIISSLRNSLQSIGAEEMIYKKYNSIALNTEKIDCDFYRLLNGEISAINTFSHNFLPEYPWSEEINEYLSSK